MKWMSWYGHILNVLIWPYTECVNHWYGHALCVLFLHVAFTVDVFVIWAGSSEFGTYRLCEQRRFRQACTSAQSRQNLRCSLIQAVSQEEPSDRKPDPWPLWMAGHAQLKFVMTECSKTQIRLTALILNLHGYALHVCLNELSWSTRKPTNWPVRPARLRSAWAFPNLISLCCPLKDCYPRNAHQRLIRLGRCPGLSESSLGHTCDKFESGIGEIFLSFQGGLWKTYRIYKKILHLDEGDFKIL